MNYSVPIFPKRLEIEIVSDCNLRCVYCPRHYLKDLNGYIEPEIFKKIITEADAYPDTIMVLHRRGETLLHPALKELLKFISGRFKEVQLATNATLLTRDKFDALTGALTFISFSLDSPLSYDRTRVPAKYSQVERNILQFLEFNGGRVRTQASMVKTENSTEDDVESFKQAWDGKVDRIRIYEEHSQNGVFGALKKPRDERKPCVMPFYEMLIYDDGNVGRCNHDWNGNAIGDLNRNTIHEIWNGPEYQELRRQHSALEITDPVCSNCDSWYPETGNQGTGEVVEK